MWKISGANTIHGPERLRRAADEVLSWNLNDTSALLSNPPQNAALFHAQVLRAARAALDARQKEE